MKQLLSDTYTNPSQLSERRQPNHLLIIEAGETDAFHDLLFHFQLASAKLLRLPLLSTHRWIFAARVANYFDTAEPRLAIFIAIIVESTAFSSLWAIHINGERFCPIDVDASSRVGTVGQLKFLGGLVVIAVFLCVDVHVAIILRRGLGSGKGDVAG